jgi:hypothetical protein
MGFLLILLIGHRYVKFYIAKLKTLPLYFGYRYLKNMQTQPSQHPEQKEDSPLLE